MDLSPVSQLIVSSADKSLNSKQVTYVQYITPRRVWTRITNFNQLIQNRVFEPCYTQFVVTDILIICFSIVILIAKLEQ